MNNEPVAWVKYIKTPTGIIYYCNTEGIGKPLYTTPQIKELSDEEIQEICHKYRTKLVDGNYRVDELEFAKAILKKASEK